MKQIFYHIFSMTNQRILLHDEHKKQKSNCHLPQKQGFVLYENRIFCYLTISLK